jgi:hypothetical protein
MFITFGPKVSKDLPRHEGEGEPIPNAPRALLTTPMRANQSH